MLKEEIEHFLLISFAYAVAYSLTLGFVAPLQQMLLPNVPSSIGLLFLPHGVRILSFYFYGWKAVLYLLPANYVFLLLSIQNGIFLDPLSPIVSLMACYVGYLLATKFINGEASQFNIKRWHFFLIAGAVSSIFNGITLSLLHFNDNSLLSVLGYVIGDVAGLAVCFFMLIYAFRLVRMASFTERD
jgi:hypothetical protein